MGRGPETKARGQKTSLPGVKKTRWPGVKKTRWPGVKKTRWPGVKKTKRGQKNKVRGQKNKGPCYVWSAATKLSVKASKPRSLGSDAGGRCEMMRRQVANELPICIFPQRKVHEGGNSTPRKD